MDIQAEIKVPLSDAQAIAAFEKRYHAARNRNKNDCQLRRFEPTQKSLTTKLLTTEWVWKTAPGEDGYFECGYVGEMGPIMYRLKSALYRFVNAEVLTGNIQPIPVRENIHPSAFIR